MKNATVSKAKLGMALFVLSEAVFFILLILAYVFFHASPESGVKPSVALDVPFTGIFTFFLLSSSGTMWLAGLKLRQGDYAMARFWLVVTIVFGAIFLVGQGAEYMDLFSRSVTISQGLFGTTFFTLTGFHGLHVFFGLVLLTILLGVTWAPGSSDERRATISSVKSLAAQRVIAGKQSDTMETISIYWHFVDVVWVFIFSIVYLWTAS
jgi:heme/copper-type cytochrome/quinol oxidase subunit 3